MDVYRRIWMYMDVYGRVFEVETDVYGCICMYMYVYGCIWTYMDVYGRALEIETDTFALPHLCIWMYIDVYGRIWTYMDVPWRLKLTLSPSHTSTEGSTLGASEGTKYITRYKIFQYLYVFRRKHSRCL